MTFRFAQIAFAGHNLPSDIGDPIAASSALRLGFELLGRAGVADARLLTGLADGADAIAVQAWSFAGLGPVHAVLPYLEDLPAETAPAMTQEATWLDGAALEAGGRSAHLAQTRWLIGAADVLVVLWDGKAGRGAGGTADAVRLALDNGVAVLWVEPPGHLPARLIEPLRSDQDHDFIELLEQLERGDREGAPVATVEAIHAVLVLRGFEKDSELAQTRDAAPVRRVDALLDATLWKTYAVFQRRLGGALGGALEPPAPPEDLSRQPGFNLLTEAYARADEQAIRLSGVHRSQQLVLLGAAVLATAIGSLPAVWPAIKIHAVLAELLLAMLALAVWWGGARASRHERWGEARRLAEQLRQERAAWALGLSSVEGTDRPGVAARAARTLRRLAGSAPGRFDHDRVSRWGSWAMEALIGSEAAYHHLQGHRNERIAHRIHTAENFSFAAFVLALAAFAIADVAVRLLGRELPHWLGGAVVMIGSIVPAIGAASLALEATLAFREQGQRSLFLATRLAAIKQKIPSSPRLDEFQYAAKAAIRLHGAQEDRWGDDAARRRLLRGG